jgi:hypothetical protein
MWLGGGREPAIRSCLSCLSCLHNDAPPSQRLGILRFGGGGRQACRCIVNLSRRGPSAVRRTLPLAHWNLDLQHNFTTPQLHNISAGAIRRAVLMAIIAAGAPIANLEEALLFSTAVGFVIKYPVPCPGATILPLPGRLPAAISLIRRALPPAAHRPLARHHQ